MGDGTGIEWTDATWNPVTGCTKVSQGCKHCYAERDWSRLAHLPAYQGRTFTDVACHLERLMQPLRWKRPRRIFVNSMSDLFHEDVPDSFIYQVFAVMALSQQHTFQVLTKRPERMLAYMQRLGRSAAILDGAARTIGHTFQSPLDPDVYLVSWPLPHVWLGVSVEDQEAADQRIPLLLQTPAAVRWVSAEPLLGPVDVQAAINRMPWRIGGGDAGLHWVVVGGESGPKARPMHPDWARSLRDQCAAAGVPYLHKQNGEWISADQDECPVGGPASRWMWADGQQWSKHDGQRAIPLFCRAGKKAAGRLLDGVLHDGYPDGAK